MKLGESLKISHEGERGTGTRESTQTRDVNGLKLVRFKHVIWFFIIKVVNSEAISIIRSQRGER